MRNNLKYTEYTRDFPKTLTGKKKKKMDEGCWQKQSSSNYTKLNPNKRQYNMTRTLVLSTKKKLLCSKAMDSKIFVFFMDLLF